MDVEVEVVREQVTTYLVMNVKSLEAAEEIAIDHAKRNLASSTHVPTRSRREAEHYVQYSEPVVVRGGKVVERPTTEVIARHG